MLVHFCRQAKKRDTQKTMNFVHLQKERRSVMRVLDADVLKYELFADNYNTKMTNQEVADCVEDSYYV